MADELIHSTEELLAATDCDDVDDLADRVYDMVDLDASLEMAPDGVSVVVDWFWCTELRYPFTVDTFWETVVEMDDESLAAYEGYEEAGRPGENDHHPYVRSPVHRFVLAREAAESEPVTDRPTP